MRSSDGAGFDCFLSLGSNLGDRESHLGDALELLASVEFRLEKCSSVYETEPVDYRNQDRFLNLVCQGSTPLLPREMLACCQEIERRLGRRRDIPKGPRVIDLDILLFGDLVVCEPDLRVPHPGLRHRRFVLTPLVEIAPEVIDPESGLTAARLLEVCPDNSSVIRLELQPLYLPVMSFRASAKRSPKSR